MQVESRSAAFESLKIPGDKKKYILDTLEPILEPLVSKVLNDLPEDPVAFMIDYLTNLQGKSDVQIVVTESVVIDKVVTLKDVVSRYFEKLSEPATETLIEAFTEIKGATHEAVVTSNDEMSFYIVASGNLNCYQPTPENVLNVVRPYKQGDVFGDVELLAGVNSDVSIVAQDDCVLWKLEAAAFIQAMRPFDSFVSTVFSSCDRESQIRIGAALREKSFAAGEVIVEQGAEATTFYLVKTGACRVTSGETEMAEKHEGDYFGEYALIHESTQAATVTAVDDVTLLTLDKEAFGAVLGEAIINEMKAKYE